MRRGVLSYSLTERGGTSQLRFFHGDHLGTTRQLTDATGASLLASAADYSPFGSPLSAAGGSALSEETALQFTGQYRDSGPHATNLQWHRARWLNTQQGRWLSQDPVFDWPGNFGNRFNYIASKVNNLSDQSGLLGFLAGAALVIAVFAILFLITLQLKPYFQVRMTPPPPGNLPLKDLDWFLKKLNVKGDRHLVNLDPKDFPAPTVKQGPRIRSYYEPADDLDLDAQLRNIAVSMKKGDVLEIHGHGHLGSFSIRDDSSFSYQQLDYIQSVPASGSGVPSEEKLKPIDFPEGIIVHIFTCHSCHDGLGDHLFKDGSKRPLTWESDYGPALSRYFGGNLVIGYTGNTVVKTAKSVFGTTYSSLYFEGDQKTYIYDETQDGRSNNE